MPFYLPASHNFDFFLQVFMVTFKSEPFFNRFALLPQLLPSLLGITDMLRSLGLCLNPWASGNELFHHENWTSIPSFCFLSFKLVISLQDGTMAP